MYSNLCLKTFVLTHSVFVSLYLCDCLTSKLGEYMTFLQFSKNCLISATFLNRNKIFLLDVPSSVVGKNSKRNILQKLVSNSKRFVAKKNNFTDSYNALVTITRTYKIYKKHIDLLYFAKQQTRTLK